ncbi:MAG: DivIVA domain-containing protein [Tetrasphaera sp.]|nr:DivIVA domain-containing protein [Tetrasphaera sp.]
MIWALLTLAVVGGVAGAALWLRAGRLAAVAAHDAADGIPLRWRGYRMEQVDDVLDRLEEQVHRNAAALAELRGQPAPAPPAPPARLGESAAAIAAADSPNREDTGLEPAEPEVEQLSGRSARGRWADLGALTAYALFAGYLLRDLLADPAGSYLYLGVQDQQAFEWYYSVTAGNVLALDNPLFSDLQNFPAGVNLMANAAMLGLGVPLTPITALAGPSVTFVLLLWAGLGLTTFAWYRLFARRLGVGRAAAFVGGAVCGFAPGVISHANGHPNFVVGFLIPVIIDRTLAVHEARGRREIVIRSVVVGLLVAWQVLIGEEPLLLAAIGMACVGLVHAAHRRLSLVRLAPVFGIGAPVALAIVGYPLWWQFNGPQSYREVWHPDAGNDLASLWSTASMSWGSDIVTAGRLALNRTEENAFFGVGIWLVSVLVIVLLWRRRPLVRGLLAVIILATWLSLGMTVTWEKNPAGVPSLWAFLEDAPIVENILPTRFTLIVIPAFGALLALGVQEVLRRSQRAGVPLIGPVVAAVLVTVAVVQAIPTPLIVRPRESVPAFFADGLWRDYVEDGSVLVVPPPTISDARALEWQAVARRGFPLVGGYFVGPDGSGTGQGTYGAPATPLTTWLAEIAGDRQGRTPSETQRAELLAELEKARVDVVVLPPRPEADALRVSLDALLGPATEVGGVEVWDLAHSDGRG